eukprot:gnl/MRDRNA2_/MRDRNA2_120612_c0_seq1.p1 gnl/MRDRNA2_/MRDRNA2_120612_c0~~gnl/MRDRNA2_/MRDRNA2_120612_c0_seq1.p1  ORF type:complete len:458 (-),score=90.38 gnl/MRDRNA2_/MRDRNA2_120612_c0_seq1:13-1386(-)
MPHAGQYRSPWRAVQVGLVFFMVTPRTMSEGEAVDMEYDIVCDAGSTGTRLYLISYPTADKAALQVDVVGKIKPGLSSYADKPSDAVLPLLGLFKKASERISEDKRASTKVTMFGTAGLRSLPPDAQKAVWAGVRSGLEAAASRSEFSFPADHRLRTETVDGHQEGFFALLSANFLTGHISHTLISQNTKPIGVLDLGGSSTQIAIPGQAEVGVEFGQGALVESYTGFGMEMARKLVDQELKAAQGGLKDGDTVESPCYFHGYEFALDTLKVTGAGNAAVCREKIESVLNRELRTCVEDRGGVNQYDGGPCLGAVAKGPGADAIRSLQFIAVSGFVFVSDFISWWLSWNGGSLDGFPKPSMTALREGADKMCAGTWKAVEERTNDKNAQHQFTGLQKAPHRCFEANYILTLLGKIYGFPDSSASILFADDLDGRAVEWPLGAHIRMNSMEKSPNHEL